MTKWPKTPYFTVSELIRALFPRQTGTWDLPESSQVPPELEEFMTKGSAIAMGWGSMIALGLSPCEMLAMAPRKL